MKDHTITIYDISEQAGVSIATVSRVLNGSPNVSEATRKKVMDAIAASGYTPNAFARGLGLNTMKTVGILAADSSDLYLAKAIYHLERELRANDYDCLLCCTGYELEDRKNAIDLLLSKKVDGIILVGSNFIYDTDEENAYIVEAARTVPVMLLNGALEAPNVYSITSDDYKSMYEAACELIDAGVTNILYYYNSISYSGKRKEKGFRAALKDRGVSVPENHFQYFDGTREDVPGMAAQLMALHKKGVTFDGIIAADDTLALSAVKYARMLGLSVPEEFSIIGYNNSMLSTCSDPELSSIDNKLETLCQHLTATLMGVLGGSDMPKVTIFSGEIAHRQTSRPVNA